MTALTVVAPTDAQLGYIASLCREWGWQPPGAVHSKQEASEIIAAMQDGSYSPERYEVETLDTPGSPTDYGPHDYFWRD